MQRLASRCHELRHSFYDRQSCLHGVLGIMFVGLGIAEIRQDAVAHVFGDQTTVALNQRRATAMIGADDLSQALEIKPGGHGGRADKVARHHSELPTFGSISRPRGDRSQRHHGRDGAKLADCAQQFPAIAKDDAEIFPESSPA